jgi:hypothetical protein
MSMGACLLLILANLSGGGVVESKPAAPVTEKAKTPAKMGAVNIIGNYTTADEYILKYFALFPGQELQPGDLPAAHRRLSHLFFLGVACRPAIVHDREEDESEFKTVLITVHESPGAFMLLKGYDATRSMLGIAGPKAAYSP